MNLYFDFEFTGLRQGTTPVSLGVISEDGRDFYAEFSDYDSGQVDEWLEKKVISRLRYPGHKGNLFEMRPVGKNRFSNMLYSEVVFGDRKYIAHRLMLWLGQFEDVVMRGDVLGYDWVLFCELFGGAMAIPSHVYYIPDDLATALKMAGFDPDVSREEFACLFAKDDDKHGALHDAKVIRECFKMLKFR